MIIKKNLVNIFQFAKIDSYGEIYSLFYFFVDFTLGQLLKPFREYVGAEYTKFKSDPIATAPIAPKDQLVDWRSELAKMKIIGIVSCGR